MGKYEVYQLKSGKFVCRDKEIPADKKRKKTYLKSDERKLCITQMRRLYLSDARKNRKNKKLVKPIDDKKQKEKEEECN